MNQDCDSAQAVDGRLSVLGMCQLFLVMPPPPLKPIQSQWSLPANKAYSILGKPVFQIMWFWLTGLTLTATRLSSL